MSSEPLTLAAGFSPATEEEWIALVEKSLKGAPFDKKMITKTYEGFDLHPLYTHLDEKRTPVEEGLPGFAPFLRGASAAAGLPNGWEICQKIEHPDPLEANRQILSELEGGAHSALLHLDWVTRCGLDERYLKDGDGFDSGGIFIETLSDLETVLNGVFLDIAPVRLSAGNAFEVTALALMALWERKGIAPASAKGAFNADPIGEFAHGDPGAKTPEHALDRLGKLALYAHTHWPKATTALVDGAVYHGAGASESWMMAAMLATGVAYLRAMEAAGLSPADAARQIVFNMPTDADQFMGIAKFRAFRQVWGRVLEACGVPEDQRTMEISATTAERMLTKRDPWVNMLRVTISTFSAIVGGASIITVAPFDAALGLPTDFSRRIARNVQLLLMEESNLGRVIDPAGGSWYVETLSARLAETTWEHFRTLEAEGGIVEALKAGSLEETIYKICETRQKAIANRRQPITGVNEFPNFKETLPETPEPDWIVLELAAFERASAARAKTESLLSGIQPASSCADVLSALQEGAPLGALMQAIEPRNGADLKVGLWGVALAQDYETLRDQADGWKQEHGAYPSVFLVTLGPVSEHTGRATFARNLFEAGGFEAITSGPLETVDDVLKAYTNSNESIAVICGTDERYETDGVAVAQALQEAGVKRLYLAGKPTDALQEAGVDEFVYVGCPVYDVLDNLQQIMGVSDDDEGEV